MLNRIKMNNYYKKGLYALVYPPCKEMPNSYFETMIKIGRTGKSFKKRFKSYTGKNKITEDVAVHLYPLDIPKGYKHNYGFTEEEAWVRNKIKNSFMKTDAQSVKRKKDQEEHYIIRTEKANLFLQITLDLYRKVQNKNRVHNEDDRWQEEDEEEEDEEEEDEKEKESSLSSLWRFARSKFNT